MRREGKRYNRQTAHTLKYCSVCAHGRNTAEILINVLPGYVEQYYLGYSLNYGQVQLAFSLNKRKRWNLLKIVENNSSHHREQLKMPFIQCPPYPSHTKPDFAAKHRKLRPRFLYNPTPKYGLATAEEMLEVLMESDQHLTKVDNHRQQYYHNAADDWIVYSYEEDCSVGPHSLRECEGHCDGNFKHLPTLTAARPRCSP